MVAVALVVGLHRLQHLVHDSKRTHIRDWSHEGGGNEPLADLQDFLAEGC